VEVSCCATVVLCGVVVSVFFLLLLLLLLCLHICFNLVTHFTKLWTSVMGGDGPVEESDANIWKVQSVAWMDSTHNMLIRECWIDLLSIVFNNEMVILGGMSGRGKSIFLLCAVFHILHCAKNNKRSDLVPEAVFPDNPRIMYVSRDGVRHLATTSSVVIWNRAGWPEDVDYCFSDNVDIADPASMGSRLTMAAATSEDSDNVLKEFRRCFNTFTKHKSELFMPSLGYEEMQRVFPDDNEASLRFKFDVIGGNPRSMNIAPVPDNASTQFYQVVGSALCFVFGDEYTQQRGSESEQQQSDEQRLGQWAIDIVLMHLQVALKDYSKSSSASTDRSFFMEYAVDQEYSSGVKQYSSFFLGLVAGKLQESVDSNVMRTLSSLFGASGMMMGSTFQYTAHAAFANIESVWCKTSTGEIEELPLGKRTVKRIRNVNDIENLTKDDYGLPAICNFPLIDAVLPPHTGLQMTTSTSHQVSATSLPSILAKLGIGSEQFQLVFVVPDDVLASFTFPSGLGNNVKMFVTVPKAMTKSAFRTLLKKRRRGSKY
jgi:hypothetical protein